MHILFLTDNFPPEGNAPASRTYDHAVRWTRDGHRVTVITGAPNFPEGVVFDGYKNAWYRTEDMDGIRVVRVKSYITANQGFRRRTLDYMSFMVTGFLAGLFQQRPDVIVGTSPQFFTVCAAWVLAIFRRRPWVFELRDLWPDSIRAVGAMTEGRALRALDRLEMQLYRKADAIVSVTRSFKEKLVERGVEGEKIHVVINGVDLERYSPRPKDQALVADYDLEGKFIVGYIGTHGLAHALNRVLEAAALLRERKDIVFIFVGSGAQRGVLIDQAAEMGLENVRFIPRQPKERMPAYWSLCDCSLVSLKDTALFDSVIPSKIFESMGMGLPILASIPGGEATRILEDAGAGFAVPPERPQSLVEAVLRLADDRALTDELGQASRRAAERYSRDAQARLMLDALRSLD